MNAAGDKGGKVEGGQTTKEGERRKARKETRAEPCDYEALQASDPSPLLMPLLNTNTDCGIIMITIGCWEGASEGEENVNKSFQGGTGGGGGGRERARPRRREEVTGRVAGRVKGG
jgi:hypothetical protein